MLPGLFFLHYVSFVIVLYGFGQNKFCVSVYIIAGSVAVFSAIQLLASLNIWNLLLEIEILLKDKSGLIN